MRIAIIGSRTLFIEDIGRYISDCDEVVSGGAKGQLFRAAQHNYYITPAQLKSMKKCPWKTDSTYCIILGVFGVRFTPKSCGTSHLAK